MKLSKLEQESIILYNEEESTASIYTHDPKLKRKLKCLAEKYPDKVYQDTHGKGVTFATGTPISNSMTELYTMMRYLQHDMLKRNSLTHFDCWASAFGETTTAIELAPEGYTLVGR